MYAEEPCANIISAEQALQWKQDGSTWEIIENLAQTSSRFMGIKLSRNRGHQNALLAGLMWA